MVIWVHQTLAKAPPATGEFCFMAKQRMINTKFWSDPWVVDKLNPLDRYLFLYLLTNEKTNIAGVYELSLRTMSNETGIEKEELLRMLNRLESRVVYVMEWVVFRNAIKHQNNRSPKIEVALARELQEVPSDVMQYMNIPVKLSDLLLERYGIDTVSHLTKVTKPNLTKVTKPNHYVMEQAPDEIKNLYYQVIKQYELPVKNHNNVRAAIAKLKSELNDKAIVAYLNFLLTQYQSIEFEHKPELSEGLDIYAKRVQISNGIKRGIKADTNSTRGIVL